MTTNEYQFTTHWRVKGTPGEVYDVLRDPTDLVRWWPAIYQNVIEVNTGDSEESVYELTTTGWLPYTLRWRLHPIENIPHRRIELEARGDLVGRGVWTIISDPEGPWVDIVYEWNVRAEKPLLRRFSWLFRPIFAWNHRWAMATGETSLRLELARRYALTEHERAQLPEPPEPTPTSSLPLVTGLLLLALVIYSIARKRWRNR
jgi:hypothetical protein